MIAVLIPCFNEEATVRSVIREYSKALPGAVIYVYDNNSADRTAEIARTEGAVVRRESRQGKGNVVRSMLRDIDADCYLLVDGDDTYPADRAAEMCRMVLDGEADMVIGDRLSTTYFSENKRPFHGAGNILVRNMINLLWRGDEPIRDVMTGSRALSPLFAKSFPVTSKGFEIETEMTVFALDSNFVVRNVPVSYRDRPEGSCSKLDTFNDGARIIATIFRLARDYMPLRFFGGISLAMLVLSSVLFFPVLLEYLQTGLVPRLPTLVTSGFLAVFSILMFCSGLILEAGVSRNRKHQETLITLVSMHLKRRKS